ncbi:MAG: DUF692 domain-containing protein [Steroidobacteraceae bacterium]|nr:DUF692 domain-containing protein [Steroidobacteraceae bacterium]MDW8259251.1 DUF692 domain-containing protein [Gammaproteobacteria bacterium]
MRPAANPPRAGIGLRAIHHDAILADRPDVGWLEVHSENYFAAGGAPRWYLEQARERYPLALHGVGLSIGGSDPLDREHLAKLRRLIDAFEPMFVSEHLSWSSAGGIFSNELLPLPSTREALEHLTARIGEVQERLGRPILIENISSYLRFDDDELPEEEFLSEVATRSGCGLLLDINNLYVNACNHGLDARRFIARLPVAAVHEIHLAGHSIRRAGECEILIDTHSAAVCDAVWDLYAHAIERFGAVPTLIEWDVDVPPLATLVAEARRADRIAAQACRRLSDAAR